MKIGIIGAMDIETERLKSQMAVVGIREVAGMSYYSGTLEGQSVVVVTCGVGKVNAAACTQILLSEFKVDAIINTGVSGAIHSSLNVGDVVISTDCMEHDFDCTGFGYAYGIIPRMDSSVFLADEQLVQAAYEACATSDLKVNYVKGRIVSGDQFVSSAKRKQFIETHFEAYTTEMEGAAIAHVCHLSRTPFVIIRAMSDKADGSAHVNFDTFALEAAENSNRIVTGMLKRLQ